MHLHNCCLGIFCDESGAVASSTERIEGHRLRSMKLTQFLSHARLRSILCALLIVVIVVATGCDERQERDRRYIEDSERQWAESVATNDSSVLERILDDDFVWIYPDGSKMNKAQAIADARRGPGFFVSNHLDEVSIRFYGRTAVAQGSESWVQRDASGEKKGRFVWTDVWVKRDDRWRIVASQDMIPPTTEK
jgi:ketosteroid isomerase-like protein